MPADCKTCQAPDKIKDLIERMRTAGISYRDCADVVKTVRQYDISHAAIQRHEVDGHFSPQAIVSANTPLVDIENLTIKTIVDRKIRLWWNNGGRDTIPDSAEIRQWLKTWAELQKVANDEEENKMLRGMFKQAALPAGNVNE